MDTTDTIYILRVPHQTPPDLTVLPASDLAAIRRWQDIDEPRETGDLSDDDATATHTALEWRINDLHYYEIGTLSEIAEYRGHQQDRVRRLVQQLMPARG